MGDVQVALGIQGQAVRPAQPAVQLGEHADLADDRAIAQGNSPDLLGTGHGHQQVVEVGVVDNAVGAGDGT
ncbi:hypothetical protein D3C76_1644810 [compost metagenome]